MDSYLIYTDENIEYNIPPLPNGGKKISSQPIRDRSSQLHPESSSFELRSGILLWGQLRSVFAGSIDQGFQGNAATLPAPLPGGTILQHVFQYRSAARNGRWKVRKVFSNTISMRSQGPGAEPTRHFGWILYHEDVDPLESVKKCSRITTEGGISLRNQHADKDVLYINRYDWSYHGRGSADNTFPLLYRNFVQAATGPRLVNTEGLTSYDIEGMESLSTRSSGYLLAIDADYFSSEFVGTFVQTCPAGGPLSGRRESEERLFGREGEDKGFGAFVSMPRTEFEFGWLLFSGKKHDLFPEADELVAILYDGVYDVLEGDEFAVEDEPEVNVPTTTHDQ